VRSIRASHHQLARLLALGHDETQAALATGYSLAWVSQLKGDPAFDELVAHYRGAQDLEFLDAQARMRKLGLEAVDELQERLETAPEKFGNRDLMDLAEKMMGGPAGRGGGTGAGAPAPPAIHITFGGPAPSGPVVDGKVEP
jgi:hypothetical protein